MNKEFDKNVLIHSNRSALFIVYSNESSLANKSVKGAVRGLGPTPGQPVMANLGLLAEDGAMTERWELGNAPLAVGRDATADVIVNDAALSRRHFLILRDADGYSLKDLGSQNGTWVDGRLAKTTKLHHHDCILAGRTLFLFSDPPTTSPAAMQPAAVMPAGRAIA